ncbi:MAG: glycine zipper family protein [Rudaea sp.]
MKARLLVASTTGALLLAACVTMPTAPMVTVLPGSTKGFDQFRIDDDYCRGYAYSVVVGPSQAATNTAAANAAAATAIGAAAGAIIGSVSGDAGAGAAIGAGSGLLFGTASGADALGYSSWQLQRQYDGAYVQCMYARGNRVPVRAYTGSYGAYSAPSYTAPNPPPNGATGYPPPTTAPDSIPPPNTPPPRM